MPTRWFEDLPKLNSQACGDTNYVPAATPGNLRRFTCPARIRRSLATEQTHSAARCRNRDFHFDLPAQRNMQAYLSWSRESNSFLPWKSIAAGTLRRGRFCLFPGHQNPGTAINRNQPQSTMLYQVNRRLMIGSIRFVHEWRAPYEWRSIRATFPPDYGGRSAMAVPTATIIQLLWTAMS